MFILNKYFLFLIIKWWFLEDYTLIFSLYLFLKWKMCKITLYIIFRREFTPRHWGFIPISSGRKAEGEVGDELTRFCWTLAQSVLKRPKTLCPLHGGSGHMYAVLHVKKHCMVTKDIPEFPTQSSEATVPLQSHQRGDNLSLPSPVHHLLFLSYTKFTSATGTNEEGLRALKISLLNWELRKIEGSGCGKTYPWMSKYGAHRQAGLPSHPPEVNQLLGNPSRQKPQAAGLCDLNQSPIWRLWA